MSDKREESQEPPGPAEKQEEGASNALNTALQKTFEALLQEPVPDRFQTLLTRIREEESRKAANDDTPED